MRSNPDLRVPGFTLGADAAAAEDNQYGSEHCAFGVSGPIEAFKVTEIHIR